MTETLIHGYSSENTQHDGVKMNFIILLLFCALDKRSLTIGRIKHVWLREHSNQNKNKIASICILTLVVYNALLQLIHCNSSSSSSSVY